MKITQIGKICMIAGIVATMGGCVDAKNYSATVDSWQGASKDQLVRQWGQPSEIKTLGYGTNQLYIYHFIAYETPQSLRPTPGLTRLSPQNNSAMLSRVHPLAYHKEERFWCNTFFEVNKQGLIVKTDYTGNNCVLSQRKAQRWTFDR